MNYPVHSSFEALTSFQEHSKISFVFTSLAHDKIMRLNYGRFSLLYYTYKVRYRMCTFIGRNFLKFSILVRFVSQLTNCEGWGIKFGSLLHPCMSLSWVSNFVNDCLVSYLGVFLSCCVNCTTFNPGRVYFILMADLQYCLSLYIFFL